MFYNGSNLMINTGALYQAYDLRVWPENAIQECLKCSAGDIIAAN